MTPDNRRGMGEAAGSSQRKRQMTHYYFDIHDGTSITRDEIGLLLLDREAARGEALKALGEITRDLLLTVGAGHLTIDVREELGTAFFSANTVTESDWVE